MVLSSLHSSSSMAYQFPPSFTTQFYPCYPNITTVTPSFPSYSTNISLVTPSQNLSYNHGYTPHLQPAYDYYTPFYQQNNSTPFIPPYQPTPKPSDSTSHHSNVFPKDHYHHQQATTSISPHLHPSYTISQQTHLPTDSVQEIFQECCQKLAQAEEKYQNQKRAIEEKYQASILSIKKRSQELKEKYVFKRNADVENKKCSVESESMDWWFVGSGEVAGLSTCKGGSIKSGDAVIFKFPSKKVSISPSPGKGFERAAACSEVVRFSNEPTRTWKGNSSFLEGEDLMYDVDTLKGSSGSFARKVFDGMPERDTVLWNTMINGLVKNCCFEDSVEMFGEMVTRGVKMDSSTVTAVLPAAAELHEMRVGMGIQCLALKFGFHFYDYVLTGLMSLYSKCGDVNTARLLFGMIRKPDLIAYNAMISGFTSNGETECSVKLFRELLVSGEKFSSSTIVGLIPLHSPFGHLHLACSIHGFCVKSGPAVWGTLLGACMIHKNTNIARLASERLFELDPGSVGYYVLLSNIYSEKRNFPKAASIRQVVKIKFAVKKIIIRTLKFSFWGIMLQGGYSHAPDELVYGVDMKFIRWCGILQRIALVYCVVALIETFTTKLRPTTLSPGRISIFTAYKWQWFGGFAVFLIYMITTFALYVPDWSFVDHVNGDVPKKYTVLCEMRGHPGPACNAVGYVDRRVWGVNHLYSQPVWRRLKACTFSSPGEGHFRDDAPSWCLAPYEPEGLLSSVSAILSGTIGIHYGLVLIHFKGHSERLKHWLSMGFVLLIIAIVLHFTDAIPINKQLYSLSYVCFTVGAAGIVFSALYILIDVCGIRTPFLFLEWIGMNAMLVFVMAAQGIFAAFVNGWYYEDPNKSLVHWIKKHVFVNVWKSEKVGTLLYVIFAEITFWGVVAGVLQS